jgi:hypothetical protein
MADKTESLSLTMPNLSIRAAMILSALDHALHDKDDELGGNHFDLAHLIHEYSRSSPCFLLRYRLLDLHQCEDVSSMVKYLLSCSLPGQQTIPTHEVGNEEEICRQMCHEFMNSGTHAQTSWIYVACIRGEIVDMSTDHHSDAPAFVSPLSPLHPPFIVYEYVDRTHNLHSFSSEAALRDWLLTTVRVSALFFTDDKAALPTGALFHYVRQSQLNPWYGFDGSVAITLFHSAERLDSAR